MAKSDSPPRVAVIGAGPIGLEAALYATRLKLPVKVHERYRTAEHLRRWGHVRLFSPFGTNVTPLGRAAILAESPHHEFPADNAYITGREHVACYLEPLAKLLGANVVTQARVLQVGRRGLLKEDLPGDARRARSAFRLLVADTQGKERYEEADVVLDCSGVYGTHRWLGDGGIPAVGERAAEPHILYTLEDVLGEQKDKLGNKTILVVGSGYSAATTVCLLAALAETHPDTWVIWLARGSSSQPVRRLPNDPFKERDRLAVKANMLATRNDSNVEFFPQAQVEAVEHLGQDKGFKVTALCAGKSRTWEVDRVIANVGYQPDTSMHRELQVQTCPVTQALPSIGAVLTQNGNADSLPAPGGAADRLRHPEPGFFVLGAKTYGRSSSFLLKTGFEQVRDVFTLIAGRADLDLYKKERGK